MPTGKLYKNEYQKIREGRIYPFSGLPIFFNGVTSRWFIVQDLPTGFPARGMAVDDQSYFVNLVTYNSEEDELFTLPGESFQGKPLVIPKEVSEEVKIRFRRYWDVDDTTKLNYISLSPHDVFTQQIPAKIQSFSDWQSWFPIPPGLVPSDLYLTSNPQTTVDKPNSNKCCCGGPPREVFIGVAAAGYTVQVCQVCRKEK